MFKTLHFRLTLSYAAIFGCLAILVFGFAYLTVSKQLLAAIGEDLQDTAAEFSDLYRTRGVQALQAEINREATSHGKDNFAALYLNGSGKASIKNIPNSWSFPLPKPRMEIKSVQWFDAPINDLGETAKFIATPMINNGWLLLGLSLREYDTQMRNIRAAFGWMLLVIVLAGIGTGWWQVRRALAGVDRVRKAAIEIGDGAFDQRLELEGHGQELIDLAEAFNTMLDRIQKLIGEMRDVSDNIAHDLRSPLARIRGIAEAGLMSAGADSPPENREALATVINECDRLTSMINTMLEIAQTDAGLINQQQERIDLVMLLHDACELFQPVAEDAGMKLTIDAPDCALLVTGNKARLQRAIANLIDNALKFSHEEGHIRLIAEADGNLVRTHIRDHGIGISADDRAHIFERFYRSDLSRSKPGNGLGLSYAMSIIRSHGGTIDVTGTPGGGSTFTVRLPLA